MRTSWISRCLPVSSKSLRPCMALMLGLASLLLPGCRAANGWVMNTSGRCYYERGEYAMARGEFARAVADSPRNPDYRHNLAMTMQRQGDHASAERILRHNLSLDPMHQPTYHALAHSLMQQQRAGEAQALLTEWSDTQPYAPESHIELAWLQREQGNHAAAEQTLRRALQVEPNNPYALAHMGQIHQDTGRRDDAINFYERSLTSRRNQPAVKSRLTALGGKSRWGLSRRPRNEEPMMLAYSDENAGMPLATGLDPYGNPQPIITANAFGGQPMITSEPMMMGTPLTSSAPMLASPDPQMIPVQTVSATTAMPMSQPFTQSTSYPVMNTVTTEPVPLGSDSFAPYSMPADPVLIPEGRPQRPKTKGISRWFNRKKASEALPVYPLPTYETVDMNFTTTTMAASSTPIMSGEMTTMLPGTTVPTSEIAMPQLTPEFATTTAYEPLSIPASAQLTPSPVTPNIAFGPSPTTGPTLIPQPDPAHGPEATAGLPVVDPY